MLKRVGMPTLRLRTFLPLTAIPLLTGCIRESVNGSETVYQNELWVSISMILGGLVLTPLGWFLRTKNGRFGWAFMILGLLLAFGFGPSALTDKVTVNDSALHVHSGFWVAPTDVSVKFDDVQSVRVTSETKRTRRGGRRTNYYFNFDMKSGPSQKVQMDTLLMRGASERVAEAMNKQDIPIVDLSSPNP
jgi:hypothetical protein